MIFKNFITSLVFVAVICIAGPINAAFADTIVIYLNGNSYEVIIIPDA